MVANAQILRNASVSIQTSLASALTITGITNANPAVVTCTQSLSDGDLVVISGVVGMSRLNGRVARVDEASGTDFELEGIDTSDTALWGSYVSGGTAEEVDDTALFDNITNLSLPDAAPDEIDITSIDVNERIIVFGHDAAQRGTFSTIADPLATAILEVAEASLANERRVFKVVLSSGYTAIFNAYVSGGTGIDGGVGAAGTAEISLTLRNKPQWFAS